MTNDESLLKILPENESEWGAPILFDEVEAPDISTKLLPAVLGDFAEALSTATETASSFSIMVVLGVVSIAAARHFKVSPKPGWIEPINIYTFVGLPPANNKTQVLNSCMKPIVEWEKEQATALRPDIQRQISERKTQEKIIEARRNKAVKEEDLNTQKELRQEIIEMEATLIEPQVLPQLFVNDVTPETLAIQVHEQKNHFAIVSDEGGVTEALAGLYSGGASNVDIILKGIDGGHLRVRRKDRSIDLNPFLTIVLTAQPIIIRNMAGKKAFTGNGILERFLYLFPKSNLGFRTHDKPEIPAKLAQAYYEKIRLLLNLFSDRENKEPLILSLSPEAQKEWKTFQRSIETDLKPNGRLSICLGWGGKICGFTLRIAGLLHIAEYGDGSLIITENTMANAVEIAALLTEHAIVAYGFMSREEAAMDAKEILQWIIEKNAASFTKSDITLAMRNRKLGKTERLINALMVLIDRNIISEPKKLPTRKPTTIFYVNPELLNGKS